MFDVGLIAAIDERHPIQTPPQLTMVRFKRTRNHNGPHFLGEGDRTFDIPPNPDGSQEKIQCIQQ
jgi:hypothetical protein